MMTDPLVSIIIPSYNYGAFLPEALDSLLKQSYSNWECIVVNDGSTDQTESVAVEYAARDQRIRHIFQENSGVSSARNRALKEAGGGYIQLLDADDLLERDKLKLQVAYLEAHPHVDLVYSSIISFSTKEMKHSAPRLLQNKKPVSGKGELLLAGLLDDNLFLPGCTIARKSLYDKVGVFKKGIEGIEDWDYFYRAALEQHYFYHDDRPGTRLLARNHGNNASSNGYKMLCHKIKARKMLLQETRLLLQQAHSGFSQNFIHKACKTHTALLNRDSARLHLYYGSLIRGCMNSIKYAYYSGNPFFAFYDGAYWIKERVKKRGLSL